MNMHAILDPIFKFVAYTVIDHGQVKRRNRFGIPAQFKNDAHLDV